jgi:hypothetical protein
MLYSNLVTPATIVTNLIKTTIRQCRVLLGIGKDCVAGKYGNGESLADHLARSTPEEMADAARRIGVGVIWDRMIDPLI